MMLCDVAWCDVLIDNFDTRYFLHSARVDKPPSIPTLQAVVNSNYMVEKKKNQDSPS
jgi:hypothetical protein